jgi:hypothetical protein
MSVKRLRWWHRNKCWLGYNGWRYRWDGRVWIGEHNTAPGPIALTRRHDTAAYGPYNAMYLDRFGERTYKRQGGSGV